MFSESDCTAEKEIGLNYISSKNEFYVILAAALHDDDSEYFFKQFRTQNVINQMKPTAWWKAASKEIVPKSLLKVIERIFSLPSGTGSIERSFSTLGQIMTDQRNQLSIESASKLCCIYNHFKLENLEQSQRKSKKRRFDLIE